MKRITVITEDRKGLIAELSGRLEREGINIIAIDAIEEDGTAFIALNVDRYDDALSVLRDSEFQAVPDEVVVVRIDDEPGGLAQVSRRLTDADVSIRGMTMLQRQSGWCAVAVATDDNDRTREILADKLLDL